ncbi:hypothetical protein JQ582_04715 [Bradyrhizobium japonicum]|uniref:hypothetical protein n=1 Tax=Bradyrhizobium japonicum TaxID=375 RepID=UPI001BACC3C0|nr:hypothetical protein [Bradyrhizobium japonicum]MBR0728595.1 hypothetical protein [Bradyrhizobium japonicum]MBR0743211.1 hypothetical protein [Bradyrhizobium japonicum]
MKQRADPSNNCADVGPVVPKHYVIEAGGIANVRTTVLSPKLRIHQRKDFGRWRDPVNGARPQQTVLYPRLKGPREFAQAESRGERPMYAYFDIEPSIKNYWEQRFIVEIHDEEGDAWAIPDCFAIGFDESSAWIEGKVDGRLVVASDGRTSIERGLTEKLTAKLSRIQSAFEEAGYTYVVFNESWAKHPIIAANVDMIVHAARDLVLDPFVPFALGQLLDRPDLTLGDCAMPFADRACPEEWVILAMAKGIVSIDLTAPIGRGSKVSRPERPFWANETRGL